MDYIRVLQVRGWHTAATCLLVLILPPKSFTDRVLEETLICKSTSSGIFTINLYPNFFGFLGCTNFTFFLIVYLCSERRDRERRCQIFSETEILPLTSYLDYPPKNLGLLDASPKHGILSFPIQLFCAFIPNVGHVPQLSFL